MRGAPASPRAFNQRQLTPDGCTIGRLAHGSVPKRGSRRPGGFHPASAQQQWDGSGLAVGSQLTSCSPWPWLSQDGATAWGWQRCHRRMALPVPAVPGTKLGHVEPHHSASGSYKSSTPLRVSPRGRPRLSSLISSGLRHLLCPVEVPCVQLLLLVLFYLKLCLWG